MFDRLRHRRPDRLGVRAIRMDRHSRSAQRLDLSCDLGRLRWRRDVGQGHIRAVLGESQGDGGPDAARTAEDDRHFPLKIRHGVHDVSFFD
jgi:hypothetical protein